MAHFNGFRPEKTDWGGPLPKTRVVLGDSGVFKEGSAVKYDPQSGLLPADANSDKIFGYVQGFVDKTGKTLEHGVSGTDYDGTYTASPSGDTYTAASDNESDKKIMAIVVPAAGVICSALLDAARATSTGSDKVGCYFDIETTASNAATQLDESTATTTKAQFMSVANSTGNSPADEVDSSTSRIYVKAIEVQSMNNA